MRDIHLRLLESRSQIEHSDWKLPCIKKKKHKGLILCVVSGTTETTKYEFKGL